jgi:hypothetical protein
MSETLCDKLNDVHRVLHEWRLRIIADDDAEYRIRAILCPRPKPTTADIAWAEKRAGALEEDNSCHCHKLIRKCVELLPEKGFYRGYCHFCGGKLEEKRDVMKDDPKLKSETYHSLLQDAIDLFDAELELCDEVASPAWIWLATVQYVMHELEHKPE